MKRGDEPSRRQQRIGAYRPDEAGRTVPGNRRLPGLVPRLSPYAIATASLAGGAVILAATLSLAGWADPETRNLIKWIGVALAVLAVGWEGFNRIFRA